MIGILRDDFDALKGQLRRKWQVAAYYIGHNRFF